MARKTKINQLDQQISTLQSDLFNIRQRQALFDGGINYPSALRAATTTVSASAEDHYENLRTEWAHRSIKIPAMSRVLPKIKSALITAAQLAQELGTDPELFTLVLVPPTETYPAERLQQDRLRQDHVLYADKFDQTSEQSTTNAWKLLVIYDGIDGLDMGSAASIIAQKSYVIASYDARALAHASTPSTHCATPRHAIIIVGAWLLKDSGSSVTSVAFMSGAYRFVTDDNDLHGLGMSEVFRPAVEISL